MKVLDTDEAGNKSLFVFARVCAWMAANATQDEVRAIRERLAHLPDPFDRTWDAAVEPGAVGTSMSARRRTA